MTKIVYRKIKVNEKHAWTAQFTYDCGIKFHGTDVNLNDLLVMTVDHALADPCLEPC
jgi:hypothetical protein